MRPRFKRACACVRGGAIFPHTGHHAEERNAMIDIFKSVVKKMKGAENASAPADEALEVQIATCALLLETAYADDECTAVEQEHIARLMQQRFGLSREAFDEVRAISERRRRDEIDLWGFAATIKKSFSAAQKTQLMEMLWSVIYADDRLADDEDHLAHSLAKLLGLDHRDMIEAKVRVLDARPELRRQATS